MDLAMPEQKMMLEKTLLSAISYLVCEEKTRAQERKSGSDWFWILTG